MSVRHALLALLSTRPASTYQLRKAFDETTGQVWPLNIGQASTTLARLERDGLVTRAPDTADDSAGIWSLTEDGREELRAWWDGTVSRAQPDRHELVMKLAVAVTVPGVEVAGLVQNQRLATLSALHEVTRARRSVAAEDLAAGLVLDHHIFAIDAELRWLDEVEEALARVRTRPPSAPPAPTGSSTSHDAARTPAPARDRR